MGNAAGTTWDGKEVMAASMEAMAVIDENQYVMANQTYANLYGFAQPDDLVGEYWDCRLAENERSRFERDILPTCREDGQWRGTITGRRRDGSTFVQHLSLSLLEDEYFIWVSRERDHSEQTPSDDENHLQLIKHVFDAIDDIVYVLDGDGTPILWNAKLREVTGYTDAEIEAMSPQEFITPEQHEYVPGLIEAIDQLDDQHVDLTLVTKDGERIPHAFRGTTFEDPEASKVYRCGVGRDITDRKQYEEELERQRDELATLDRINELILEITRNLFESPTRNEIEQTVCDRLAASELYQFAWIGAPDTEGNRILSRTSAGIDDGYIEAATITTTETETGQGPGGRAFRTGELQVSQDVRSDPTFEPWREEALNRSIKAAAAVPLVYGGTTYGILAVYATRPFAFSQREQAGFKTLGKAIGFAINAIENRNLLFADRVVELEFEVADSELVFVRLSEQLECELTITGYVESTSGNWSVYLSIEGATPSTVGDIATTDPDVSQVRVIADEDANGLLELVIDEEALTELTEHGAILTSGHVTDGRGRFCVEIPPTTDVRQLTGRLQAVYPESTLVAQREFDRPVQQAGEIRQSIDDRLTDRQQEALTRAYHAGYFDWPRQCTAGDIADSMDIAETTFHYHLRNALDTLSAALIDIEQR